MAFKLFNKDKNSNNNIPEVPDLDIPEPPKLDDNISELPDMDIPEPPTLEPIKKEDIEIPDFDVPMPEHKIEPRPVPKPEIKDSDLPDFPDAGMVKDKEVPEPPAFLSKMDDVKNDMENIKVYICICIMLLIQEQVRPYPTIANKDSRNRDMQQTAL